MLRRRLATVYGISRVTFAPCTSSTSGKWTHNAFHQRRSFMWQYILVPIFNQFDREVVQEVGPDVAAARWLLRNGGAIRWVGSTDLLHDYNSLPKSSKSGLHEWKLEEIDATDASISGHGFRYLEGLSSLKKMRLAGNDYVGDGAMEAINKYLGDQRNFSELDIISVPSISDRGIAELTGLRYLRVLYLYHLLNVNDREGVLRVLKEALPRCDVRFPATDMNETVADVFKRKK